MSYNIEVTICIDDDLARALENARTQSFGTANQDEYKGPWCLMFKEMAFASVVGSDPKPIFELKKFSEILEPNK